MEINVYIENMKRLQKLLLNYIENEDDNEENLMNLMSFIREEKMHEDKHELESLLYLISNIANNHSRQKNFFSKIDTILVEFKSSILKSFSNDEIFNIFMGCKRMILLLLESGLIVLENSMFDVLMKDKKYFTPEIETMGYKVNEQPEPSEDFNKLREIGENPDCLCAMIREDMIDDFIAYVKKNDIILKTQIKISDYETNPFLQNHEITMLEYAAFFGAIQIFKYLNLNGLKFSDLTWMCAVHGEHPEIFQMLERRPLNSNLIKEALDEAVKCHHNCVAEYIMKNLIYDESHINQHVEEYAIEFRNYAFFPQSMNNNIHFFLFCKFNYFSLVKIILETQPIDVYQPINDGSKPLRIAAVNNFPDLLELLLSQTDSIKEEFFKTCERLKHLSIPSNIQSINQLSFCICTSLEWITIPPSVTHIGTSAFSNCSSLRKIVIPDSVHTISPYTFNDCKSLADVTLPNTLTEIGKFAFHGCSSLIQIDLTSSITKINDSLFAECTSLKKVIIPPSVTYIGWEAFFCCSSLVQIDISNSVTYIGDSAFEKCSSLSDVTIPNTVTKIKPYTFANCSSLVSVKIPSSIVSIGRFAFLGCSSLESLNVPAGINEIESGTFSSCTSLKKVSLPNSITRIGRLAFQNCQSLTEVTVPPLLNKMESNAFEGCTSLPEDSPLRYHEENDISCIIC